MKQEASIVADAPYPPAEGRACASCGEMVLGDPDDCPHCLGKGLDGSRAEQQALAAPHPERHHERHLAEIAGGLNASADMSELLRVAPCPVCGRLSRGWHRQACKNALRRTWPERGEKLPRCETCSRAVRPGRVHVCKPLKRSHRLGNDDAECGQREAPKPITLRPWPGSTEFPLRTRSTLNMSGLNRFVIREQAKRQRREVEEVLRPYEPPTLPVEVTLVRLAYNPVDAHDNLRICFKHVADSIAEFLGCDDRDKRITWLYGQETHRELVEVMTKKGPARENVDRVRITIREIEAGPRTVPCPVCSDVSLGVCVLCHGQKCSECRRTGRCSRCYGLGIVDDPNAPC